jgi:hypothetical protein
MTHRRKARPTCSGAPAHSAVYARSPHRSAVRHPGSKHRGRAARMTYRRGAARARRRRAARARWRARRAALRAGRTVERRPRVEPSSARAARALCAGPAVERPPSSAGPAVERPIVAPARHASGPGSSGSRYVPVPWHPSEIVVDTRPNVVLARCRRDRRHRVSRCPRTTPLVAVSRSALPSRRLEPDHSLLP